MIAIIAAYDRNRLIGQNGRLPWHIPGEQRRFRALTLHQAVVMGRRTFEEIGRALPERKNIVLTSQNLRAPGVEVARSMEEALRLAEGLDVYISGGAAVYAQALERAQKLYITEIDAAFCGDRFFPAFDETQYIRTLDGFHGGEVPYSYVTYTKIPSSDSGARR